jgi:feruloyl esterase
LTATCTRSRADDPPASRWTDARRIEPAANVNAAGLCQVPGTRAPFLDIEVDVPD